MGSDCEDDIIPHRFRVKSQIISKQNAYVKKSQLLNMKLPCKMLPRFHVVVFCNFHNFHFYNSIENNGHLALSLLIGFITWLTKIVIISFNSMLILIIFLTILNQINIIKSYQFIISLLIPLFYFNYLISFESRN